jgi:competence protein ComEA
MLKKILAFVAMLYVAACFAAVDVNKGNAADLDSVKGIGPAISGKIVEERKKGSFKDWSDFINRVSGIGEKSAAKLSEAGLTVNGTTYKGAAPAAGAKKDEKPAAAKADAKAAPAAAAPAKEEKKDAKAEAKAEKEAEKKAKAEEKQKKADEAKAKKEAAKKAKDDAKKAKEAKPAAKAADAPTPAASAAKK